MVWIDTDGLRSLGRSLEPLRDELVPLDALHDPVDVLTCGSDRLAGVLNDACGSLSDVRIAQARQVDALVSGAFDAANRWDQAEETVAGALRPR